MFIVISIIAFSLLLFLVICDWIRAPRFCPRSLQKQIKNISIDISLGNWEEARKSLTPLLTTGKGGKEVALLDIQVLHGTNQLQTALSKTIEASRLYPEELLFRLEEGKILLQILKPLEALEAFNVCAPIIRAETDLFSFGSALLQAGFPEKCLDLIQPYLKESRSDLLLSLVGDALFALKRFQETIDVYQEAIELGSQNRHLFLQLGTAYRRFGNLSEAEKIFHELLAKDGSDIPATLELGACMQERGDYERALAMYQAGGGWKTKDPQIMTQAGICALYTKKFAHAQHYFFEALQKQTPTMQTLTYYGFALEGQQKWQQAEEAYQQLIDAYPSNPHGYRALAWMFGVGLTSTLSLEEGIRYAHIALKLKNDSISWEILSACEARVGNYPRAYQIQYALAKQDKDKEERIRRQQALRKLRKNLPLDNSQVVRSLVA